MHELAEEADCSLCFFHFNYNNVYDLYYYPLTKVESIFNTIHLMD